MSACLNLTDFYSIFKGKNLPKLPEKSRFQTEWPCSTTLIIYCIMSLLSPPPLRVGEEGVNKEVRLYLE